MDQNNNKKKQQDNIETKNKKKKGNCLSSRNSTVPMITCNTVTYDSVTQ